ncbi:hypothetical protein GGH12_001268 [Coemansia sp. RSA 1822]|nr:hypothetical protein LPJ76_002886 [Coemansia sp. RSA 638]KAJ2565678.1 hypothetical protein GGH12_001268 [Coemansia sp. RSA 1822]
MDVTSYAINTITRSDEQMLAIAQSQLETDTSSDQRQQVLVRLTRYRNYYISEIERQQERIRDINKALARFEQQTDDNRGCAVDRLTRLLEDAQKCLCEARLAKERQEMEIAQWRPSGNSEEDSSK